MVFKLFGFLETFLIELTLKNAERHKCIRKQRMLYSCATAKVDQIFYHKQDVP